MQIIDIKLKDFSILSKVRLSKLPKVKTTKGSFENQVKVYIQQLSEVNHEL